MATRMDSVVRLAVELSQSVGRPLRIAEVGVWQGTIAAAVLRQLDGSVVGLYLMVDPWREYGQKPRMKQGGFDRMVANMHKLATDTGDRAVVLRRASLEAASFFRDETFDLVFIDGDHSYSSVLEDIQAWWPLVRSGGTLAGHDYIEKWPEVVRAVDLCFPRAKKLPGTVWAMRKTPGREDGEYARCQKD